MYGHGTVSINAENIMPVIKQWLYSDKDIFVREMVSNGCDAVSKHKRLVADRRGPEGRRALSRGRGARQGSRNHLPSATTAWA